LQGFLKIPFGIWHGKCRIPPIPPVTLTPGADRFVATYFLLAGKIISR
jgi:hypothetical protein